MTTAIEMIMVLSKLNNLPSFTDRINCYKQAFSIDDNILESISKVINGSWTVRFVKDVFESFENEDDGGWMFEKFTLIFDEFGIGIDLTSLSKSGPSVHEKLVQWLLKEGVLLVRNCLKKQIEFSCIRAIRAWGIAIRLLGFSEIQSSAKTNACALVFPLAIRSVHVNVAKEAFRSWKVLATVFATDPSWSMLVLSPEKSAKIASRLELILKALKYKQVPEIVNEIFDCWWFCCISLESRLSVHFEDVAHGLLRYCVGGTTDYKSNNEEFSIIYQSVSGPLGANLVSLINSKLEGKAYSHVTLKEIPELWPRLLDVLDSLISESPKLHNTKPCVFDTPTVLCDHSVYAVQCIRFCDIKCDRNKRDKFDDRIANLFVTLFNTIYNLPPSSDVNRSFQMVLFLAQFIAWTKETTIQSETLKKCISQIENRNPFSQIEPSHTSYAEQLKEDLEISKKKTVVALDETVNDNREIESGICFSNQMMTDKTNINSSNDAQQFAPSFLFGSQQTARRSFTSKTGEYGSPGILRKRELSSGTGKTVHWSPVLVRSRSKSPYARKLHRLSGGKSASTSLWNGPPLRSLNEEIVGPPPKLSRMEPSNSEQSSLQGNDGEQVEMVEIDSASTSVWNGPPLRSLNEEIVGPPSKLSRLEPSNSQPEQSSFQSIGGEQVEIESEEVGNGSDVDFHWVTVFGFKHDHRDDVLELFSRHGDIMAQRTTKDGNWVHIRYSSPIHARQALSKNATLFRGQMIGVVPCRERDALTAQETTIPTRSNGNNFNGSCSFLENDMPSLLHVNNGDTPTRLISSTSICKEDSSVPEIFTFPLNKNQNETNQIKPCLANSSKRRLIIGKLWNQQWR
ncbi:hypothetical protein ACQ4LE_008545 [Meloidogyne hapla]